MTPAPSPKATPSLVVQLRTAEEAADVRTEGGVELRIPLPQDLAEAVNPGDRVMLYFGPNSQLLGWYAPEGHVGLDLRPP